jgi:hypothetical protein
MASKTRRTVSMTGALYRRARARCLARGESLAGWITELVEAALAAEGWPTDDPGPQPRGVGGRPSRAQLAKADDGRAIFTF